MSVIQPGGPEQFCIVHEYNRRSMRLIGIVLSWACLALGADQDSAVNGMWHAQMD